MAADKPVGTEPADQAVLLLRRVRELMLESRGVATQLGAAPSQETQTAAAERIAYGVLVASLEEGLATALQHLLLLAEPSLPPGTPAC